MIVVSSFVQLRAASQIMFPSVAANSVERPGVLLNRLSQYLDRSFVWLQLDANGSLHVIVCKLLHI